MGSAPGILSYYVLYHVEALQLIFRQLLCKLLYHVAFRLLLA